MIMIVDSVSVYLTVAKNSLLDDNHYHSIAMVF